MQPMADWSSLAYDLSTRGSIFRTGGGERVRTDDLLDANQALSQLSYTPECKPCDLKRHAFHFWWA